MITCKYQPAWFHSALLIQEMMSFWQELLPILVGQSEPRRGEETDSERKRMCSVGGVSAERDWLIGCRFMWFEVGLLGMAKTWADTRASEVLNPSQSLVVVRNARSCRSHIAVVSFEYLRQPNGSSWTQPTVVRCTVASHGTESEEGPCAAAHWAERCYLPHRASWEGFCALGIASWVGRGSPSGNTTGTWNMG